MSSDKPSRQGDGPDIDSESIEKVFFRVFSVLSAAPPRGSGGLVHRVERRVTRWLALERMQGKRSLAEDVFSEAINVVGGTFGVGAGE